jgi:hypothetical protein
MVTDPGQHNRDDQVLIHQLEVGLEAHPQAAANALRSIVEQARCRAAAGNFLAIQRLADCADDAVEAWRVTHEVSDERLVTLAILAQQVFAMLAIMGGSDGRRDSGYYRGPLAHAERLDAMTDGALRLVDLVNLIGQSEDPNDAG